ncbi:unnamed protein product [Urochloa humidicola]
MGANLGPAVAEAGGNPPIPGRVMAETHEGGIGEVDLEVKEAWRRGFGQDGVAPMIYHRIPPTMAAAIADSDASMQPCEGPSLLQFASLLSLNIRAPTAPTLTFVPSTIHLPAQISRPKVVIPEHARASATSRRGCRRLLTPGVLPEGRVSATPMGPR